jgi:hypothetical protein
MKTNIERRTSNIEHRIGRVGLLLLPPSPGYGAASTSHLHRLAVALCVGWSLLTISALAQGPNVNVVNPTARPVPVNIVAGGGGTVTAVATGAPNQASGQVTASTTAATLIAARTTRRSVLVRNLDSTISVYVGPATVTSANGMLLKAGESVPLDTRALIQVIAASGSPVVAFYEVYD